MKSGWKKLAYGESLEDTLLVLGMRISESEMSDILHESFERIPHRKRHDHIHELG